MKKALTLLIVLAMALALMAGCSQESGGTPSSTPPADPSSTAPPDDDTSEPAATGSGLGMENVKVGVVMNTSKEDGGWSQSHAASFERAKTELGLSDDQMIIMENIPDTGPDCENVTEQLIADGCNIIFGTSSGLGDAMYACASRHPDVYFHQFEGITMDNCASYTIRDYEAIFMCGYAAGAMSDVDELGFMAAQPQASVVRAINAFAAGARYANENATVKVVWANSWYDPAVEMEGASGMLDSGIKALGYHGSTTAVAQAASEAGGYCTGFHIDMHDYAPDAVLTSFIWNWTPIYVEFIQNIANGTWTNATLFKGLDAGCASVAPYNADIMPADVIAECERVQAEVTSGSVKVFAGPLLDNQGNELLAEGEEFTDEEWIGMMFLLDNVVGSLP